MRNPKYPLLALGAYLALIGVLAISTSRSGQTQGGLPPGKDVRVINKDTEPVPVTIRSPNPVPVTLQGSAHIDTSTPLPVQDVDNLSKQPIQFNLFVGNLTYTVPANKQLVIEFISGFLVPKNGSAVTGLSVSFGSPAVPATHFFTPAPTHFDDGVPDSYVYSQACRILANAGSEVKIVGGQAQAAAITGYLIDVP